MEKRWSYKLLPDQTQIDSFAAKFKDNKVLATLLLQRGIENLEQAELFFRPKRTQMHDPFLMKDMQIAVDRLHQAISNDEQIMVYGDYDVDGTTSVALVAGYLRKFYSNITTYIPDRYKEGYGLSAQGIEKAKKGNVSLLITLDCGIKALQQVDNANNLGIDVIICDHHRPGKKVPKATAILNAKQVDCSYPYKELSGCGVGFKLMQAYAQQFNKNLDDLYGYLDLLAVSIAADIVPIRGENRVMAFCGLHQLAFSPRPGLAALIKKARIEVETKTTTEVKGGEPRHNFGISNIVFGLAPRINAAGRMDHADAIIELLLSDNLQESIKFVEKIDAQNMKRREKDTLITEEANQFLDESEELRNKKSIVLYKEDWHKGVVGIVASRCIEKYYKPTIILTKSNDVIAGSARSVHGFDVHKAIEECSSLLEQYGGHMYAAGLTLKEENLEAFIEKFEKVVAASITDDMLSPMLEIDLDIRLDKIERTYANVKQMEPFGPENMTPVFATENVICLGGNARLLKDKHLKMVVKHADSGDRYDCIAFGLGHLQERVSQSKGFKIAYTIEENNFMNRKTLQLNIKDIKFD